MNCHHQIYYTRINFQYMYRADFGRQTRIILMRCDSYINACRSMCHYLLLSGAQGLGRSAATPQPSVATKKTNRYSVLGRQISHKQIHAGSMY